MPDDDIIRLLLEITPTCDAPAGTLTPEGGTPEDFSGWLDLIGALRRACGEK